MNSVVEEYIKKQTKIANEQKKEEREDFLDTIELYDRKYSENTEYTEDYPDKDTDEESPNYGKYYKEIPLQLTDEEFDAVVKAYNLTHNSKSKSDGVATAFLCIAIFVFVIGGLFAFISCIGDLFLGIALIFSVFISGMLFLGISRIISLLNDIKNK